MTYQQIKTRQEILIQ